MLQLRRVIFGGVLLAVFLVQQAGATLLPTSSWTDGEKWQGSSFYSADETYEFLKFDVRVDYAVYKTKEFDTDTNKYVNRVLEDEQALVDTFPKDIDGIYEYEYIYAYQILTRNQNTMSVGSFSLLDGDDNLMDASRFGDAGAIEDGDFGEGGIEPSDILGIGMWEFDDLAFKKGENSWYLVYGSDEAPIVGDFKVDSYQGGPVSPLSDEPFELEQAFPAPEPMSILLLGSGFFAVRRRRKSVRV